MDFAAKYMADRGWEEGKGIGKTLSGRIDPVKVKFKFDINGLGHDKAEQHKYKWWEYAFKTATDSIQVGNDQKVEKIEGKSGPIVSTSRPISKAMNRAMLYGNHFVRKGVLEGGKFTEEKADSDDSSSDEDSDADQMRQTGKIIEMTDEALFKACDGMTGHKGARHGHNMTAKIARGKAQEEAGLAAFYARLAAKEGKDSPQKELKSVDSGIESPPAIPIAVEEAKTSEAELLPKKKKRKSKSKEDEKVEPISEPEIETPKKSKKRKTDTSEESTSVPEDETPVVLEEVPEPEKISKKKKKSKETIKDIEIPTPEVEISQEVETPKKKKSKKVVEPEVEIEPEVETPEKKKKKSKKVEEVEPEVEVKPEAEIELEGKIEPEVETPKRKKKKTKKIEEVVPEVEVEPVVEIETPKRKKKKSKKVEIEESAEIVEEMVSQIEPVKTKKKKKRKIEEGETELVEVSPEVIIKKKKKSKTSD